MATLKIDPAQYAKLMNHPMHYNLSAQLLPKENMYEVECEFSDYPKIKEIVGG
jgi:hypothetical protein